MYLPCSLHPFEEEMTGKLLLLRHNPIPLHIRKVIPDQFQMTTLAYEHIPHPLHLLLHNLDIIQRGIRKHRKLLTQPLIRPVIQPLMLLAIALEDAS